MATAKATTTKNTEVSFDGRLISERSKGFELTIPIRAVSSVEYIEYTWSTKPATDKSARFGIKISYGQPPPPQWNGKTVEQYGRDHVWMFPKSQGSDAGALHRAILKALE